MTLYDRLILLFISSAVIGVAVSYQKIYLFHFLLFVILFLNFLKILNQNLKIRYKKLPSKYHRIFYFIFFWYLFSTLWSIHLSYSIAYMIYISSGTLLALVVVYYVNCDVKRLGLVFNSLAVVFVALIVISLLEVFTDLRLPHSTLSKSSRVATGFFGNQNNLATTMSMIFPFFLFHRSATIKYTGILATSLIVFAAYSRANILSLVFIFMVYVVFYKKNISVTNIWRGIVIGIVILLSISFYVSTTYSDRIINVSFIESSYIALRRYANMGVIEGYDSVGIRQQLIINGLQALKQSYGLGVEVELKYVQELSSATKIF